MIADKTLTLFAQDTRNKTLKLLEGVSDADARWSTAGLANTILWFAGHAVVVCEHLCLLDHADEKPRYPEGWFETFSWKSDPRSITQWPTVEQVVGELQTQLTRLTAKLESLSAQQLDAPKGPPEKGRTLRWYILHGLHDEANHQGEIHLMKKLRARLP